MLSLSYSSCYDPYNTVFRMLAIIRNSTKSAIVIEALRISDFFLCFPTRVTEIRPPNTVQGMRGRCNRFTKNFVSSEFEILPSSNVLFERMDTIQAAALSAMHSKEMIKTVREASGVFVSGVETSFSDKLEADLKLYEEKNADLLHIVANDLPSIPISGPNGLKARTGLGRYEYDVI